VNPPAGKKKVLCFKLRYGNSGSQAFILETLDLASKQQIAQKCATDKSATDECKNAQELSELCTVVDSNHPLLMREVLVIGIDLSEIVDDSRIKLLNINVTSQQGNPINATPVRGSFTGAATTSENAGSQPIFLAWPYELSGDVIPTVSVNAVYTPVIPGAPWQSNAFYPAGSIVVSRYNNGHFYTALNGGVSGNTDPGFLAAPAPAITDNQLTWEDSGTTLPTGAKATLWLPRTPHCLGDVITDPYNGHFYTAVKGDPPPAPPTNTPCATSSGSMPADLFPSALPAMPPNVTFTVNDGSLVWNLVTTAPGMRKPEFPYSSGYIVKDVPSNRLYVATGILVGDVAKTSSDRNDPFPAAPPPHISITDGAVTWQLVESWQANQKYAANSAVLDAAGSNLYQTSVTGTATGIPSQPFFPITQGDIFAEQDSPLIAAVPHLKIEQWQDSGTTSPASVASGQPADQAVSLLNLTLPQVHSLYYYNVAAGVVVSTVRIPNNVAVEVTPATNPATYTYLKKGSNLLIDPVLLFTAYIRPMDAERPFRPKEIWNIPGISFGMSLASPTNDFYVGGSTEVLRNFQCVYGFNVAGTAKLAVASGTVGAASSPPTVTNFSKGGFIGFTFNISGFVQGLFSGGGSKSPL
jgi:hypothetical protein